MIELTIPGRMPGLNEYTAACRANPYKGNKMKHDAQLLVRLYIRQQLNGVKITDPVRLHFVWIEKDKRRDHDNVSSFGRKVIQDALVTSGVLKNDGWGEIVGFTDDFAVDKQQPRIVVTIEILESDKTVTRPGKH